MIVIAIGIVRIISYLFKKKQEGFARTGLVSGIIFIVIGAFITIRSRAIISIIPFVLGILILFSGISKLQYAFQLRKYSEKNNNYILIVAVVNVVLGILLAFNPFRAAKVMMMVLGICMVVTGLSDIISAVYFYNKIKAHLQDMKALEQDYVEK